MNKCGMCGFPVRDGEQFCPVCSGTSPHPDAILPDGTRLYLKTGNFPDGANLQMQLYKMLFNDEQKMKGEYI